MKSLQATHLHMQGLFLIAHDTSDYARLIMIVDSVPGMQWNVRSIRNEPEDKFNYLLTCSDYLTMLEVLRKYELTFVGYERTYNFGKV
jgi:hypothetical protein